MSVLDKTEVVMRLANQEAQRFNHEYVGTEHILLGLVKEGSGVAATVLQNYNVDLRKVRLQVELIVQSGPYMVATGKLPQSPWAQNVIRDSADEARALDQNYVGSEHLLLALLREDNVATQILLTFGLNLEDVRMEVLRTLGAFVVDPSWLTWNDHTVTKLAQSINQERRWEVLPTLADALEEAGCTNALMLGHLRHPGVHPCYGGRRGCWAVDRLLDPEEPPVARSASPARRWWQFWR